MIDERYHRAVYVISVAAELAGMHPQTLRIYERRGLLEPERTAGGRRRYSEADLALLGRIAELTSEGVNLAGVQRILELERQVAELSEQLSEALEGRLVGMPARSWPGSDDVPDRRSSTAVTLYRGRRAAAAGPVSGPIPGAGNAAAAGSTPGSAPGAGAAGSTPGSAPGAGRGGDGNLAQRRNPDGC